jgi:(5-formylfuran-3-yl)methyl phosphate synthase
LNILNPLPGAGPLLLVSVRNGNEALAALKGGADIIDIKEPGHGSLGKADDAAIRDVVETVRSINPTIPLSAALGELGDWKSHVPRLPVEVQSIKLGLSHCSDNPSWRARWLDIRRRFEEERSTAPLWVMVIYADWQRARSPRPKELVQTAADSACGAVLLDTFHKDGRSLLEWISSSELLDIADEVHRAGIPLAVAGSLRKEDLPGVSRLAPQVVAIRSAACRQGQRQSAICPMAVSEFRDCLRHKNPQIEAPARENP